MGIVFNTFDLNSCKDPEDDFESEQEEGDEDEIYNYVRREV